MDKGLPNKLDDKTKTRLEFLFEIETKRGQAARTFGNLEDSVNNRAFLIEPY